MMNDYVGPCPVCGCECALCRDTSCEECDCCEDDENEEMWSNKRLGI